jgi:Tfp pilus assembly protein PilF
VVAKTEAELLQPHDAFPRARDLIQHALRLSPDMAPAYSLLAYIYMTYDLDWMAAETALQRALSLEPNNAEVLLTAGILATNLGRWDDAERQLRLAQVQDPLSNGVLLNLATALYGARRYGEAEGPLRKLLVQAPDFLWTRYYLAKVLLLQGRQKEALAALAQDADEADRLVLLPMILQASGRRAEADKAVRELVAKSEEIDAYYISIVHAYRNEPDLAFLWLNRAYEQKNVDLQEILGEPLFDNIVSDPRYKAFLRKMNLLE